MDKQFSIKVKKKDFPDLEEISYSLLKSNSTESASSHWKKYLDLIYVEINSLSKIYIIEIQQQGLADLTKVNLQNFLIHVIILCKNIFLFFKFSKKILIFFKIILISLKTRRLLNFDMIKQGILLSKTLPFIDFNIHKDIVVIGDGFGFLGTLLKSLKRDVNICFVNLEKNLFLDLLFYKIYFKNKFKPPSIINAATSSEFLPEYTLFFNVASFAEMTEISVISYLDRIKKNKGILVSLNRQEKIHPNSYNMQLNILFDKYFPTYLMNEENVEFYSKFPTRGLFPNFKLFDGPIDLKVLKFH